MSCFKSIYCEKIETQGHRCLFTNVKTKTKTNLENQFENKTSKSKSEFVHKTKSKNKKVTSKSYEVKRSSKSSKVLHHFQILLFIPNITLF